MKGLKKKVEQFRELHVPGEPLVLYNIWDPGSAQAVAQAGAKALATSSWAVAEASGHSDGENTPLAFAIDNLRRIVESTELPVTVDLESGYGDNPKKVGGTIVLAINAGAVGCNLEDSLPSNGNLRETADQAARIHSSRQAAEAAGVHFFINARTDIFLQGPVERHTAAMIDEVVARAQAYAEAGADGLFVPGLASISLIGKLTKASPLPVNIMVGDSSPSIHLLAKNGVARVSYGATPYAMSVSTLEEAARSAIG